MASTTEAQNGPAAPATLKLRRPVHSEVLLSQNTRLSFVIYQDNNPRIEWTKLDERGTQKIWRERTERNRCQFLAPRLSPPAFVSDRSS